MASQKRECPKCRGGLDEGFMLDHTHGGYALEQLTFYAV
jgi:hypothetical protein